MTFGDDGQTTLAGIPATPSYQRPGAADVEHAQEALLIPPTPVRKGPAPMPGQGAMFDA